MEVSVSIDGDPDGFLRRECPTCEREFKWFIGQTEGTPEDWVDPEEYYCPYCGVAADSDHFWTQEQADFAQQAALAEFGPEVDRMLDNAFRGASGKHITFKRTGRTQLGSSPPPPVEVNDMSAVASPCHPFEPIKIAEDWSEELHCLVCGSSFEL